MKQGLSLDEIKRFERVLDNIVPGPKNSNMGTTKDKGGKKMEKSKKRVVDTFKEIHYEEQISELPAALLTLGIVLLDIADNFDDRIAHNICLGIRHGLFGINAEPHATLRDCILSLRTSDIEFE